MGSLGRITILKNSGCGFPGFLTKVVTVYAAREETQRPPLTMIAGSLTQPSPSDVGKAPPCKLPLQR
jgi:hypothetical protein